MKNLQKFDKSTIIYWEGFFLFLILLLNSALFRYKLLSLSGINFLDTNIFMYLIKILTLIFIWKMIYLILKYKEIETFADFSPVLLILTSYLFGVLNFNFLVILIVILLISYDWKSFTSPITLVRFFSLSSIPLVYVILSFFVRITRINPFFYIPFELFFYISLSYLSWRYIKKKQDFIVKNLAIDGLLNLFMIMIYFLDIGQILAKGCPLVTLGLSNLCLLFSRLI
jgi:hypothetical protein